MKTGEKKQHIPLEWDQIEKVKTKYLPKTELFTDKLKNANYYYTSSKLKILQQIEIRGMKNSSYIDNVIYKNIYNIVYDPDLLFLSARQIEINKGAMTKGVDLTSPDSLSKESLRNISCRLKNQEYIPKPVKRIFIPKVGRAGTRPLGLPSFEDKIVQKCLTNILESIYEPVFRKLNTNYGFRPGYGIHHALEAIKINTHSSDIALEGDIKGAFDNVSHKILIKILNKRIKDQKFLKLINKFLKAGYMIENALYSDPTTGTSQGSILSPILFNIYLNEFDIYMYELTNKQKRAQLLTIDYYEEKTSMQIYYQRYADDFVIFISGNIEFAKSLKVQISEFLKNELHLTLSIEKTKITVLRKAKVKYLGFDIFRHRNVLIRTVNPRKNSNRKRFTQRFYGLVIRIDTDRLLRNFIARKYIDKDLKPREIPYLIHMEDHQIINRFNSFIRRIGIYYIRNISNSSGLNTWFSVLYYCCLKTLAQKHQTTISKYSKANSYKDISLPNYSLYKTLHTDMRICKKYPSNQKFKWAVLLNPKQALFEVSKVKYINEPINSIDYLSLYKLNQRTKFKYESCCAICGNAHDLESHHINPLRKKGKNRKYKGFDLLVISLGRKQIVVCKEHHRAIHAGKYNGMKLRDLYDYRVVSPESFLKTINDLTEDDTGLKISNSNTKNKSRVVEYVIDERTKTYYNQTYFNFLRHRKSSYINK